MNIRSSSIEKPVKAIVVDGGNARLLVHTGAEKTTDIKQAPPEAWAEQRFDETTGVLEIARNPNYTGNAPVYFIGRLAADTQLEDLRLSTSGDGQSEVSNTVATHATITVTEIPQFSPSPIAGSVHFDGVKITGDLNFQHPEIQRTWGNAAVGGTVSNYGEVLTSDQLASTALDSPVPYLHVTPYNPSR